MNTRAITIVLACTGVCFGIIGLTRNLRARGDEAPAPAPSAPEVSVERGRHLIRISGCNDCHTPGFMQQGDAVPESEWLTGVPLGWSGPWGTSYASNLRQHVAAFKDPKTWIEMVRTRKGLPPMPWPSLHAMTDDELLSIHAYIASLEVKGQVMPPPVPPGTVPSTPYLKMEPVMPQ